MASQSHNPRTATKNAPVQIDRVLDRLDLAAGARACVALWRHGDIDLFFTVVAFDVSQVTAHTAAAGPEQAWDVEV